MRFFALSTALVLAILVPLAGADAPASQTHTGKFLLAVPFGTLTQNTRVDGIDGFRIPIADGAGPGWQVRAHVDSTAETAAYDVDIHYYTAAGTHVDSQKATPARPDHCDIATPQGDQACLVPDFGASNNGLKVDVDAKEGADFVVTVTAYPPGTCPAAYPACGDTTIY